MRTTPILTGLLMGLALLAANAHAAAGPCDMIQNDCGRVCVGNPPDAQPGGETEGCIRVSDTQNCFGGHAVPPVGCICVNGTCANNFPDSAGSGCPNNYKPCSKAPPL